MTSPTIKSISRRCRRSDPQFFSHSLSLSFFLLHGRFIVAHEQSMLFKRCDLACISINLRYWHVSVRSNECGRSWANISNVIVCCLIKCLFQYRSNNGSPFCCSISRLNPVVRSAIYGTRRQQSGTTLIGENPRATAVYLLLTLLNISKTFCIKLIFICRQNFGFRSWLARSWRDIRYPIANSSDGRVELEESTKRNTR